MRLEPSDRLILRTLLGQPTKELPRGALNLKIADISERTGLHRNTVDRRLKALQEGGVLTGFLFEPGPAWLGLFRAGHLFMGTSVRDTTHFAELIEPFPFVSIAALHAESCFLHTWHATEPEVAADAERIRRALGATSFDRSFVFGPEDRNGPPLTPLDRRILLAMRRGFDRSVARIAEGAGTTRRTAARRLERIQETGAGTLLPMSHPGRIEGEVLVVYDVPHPGPAAAESLRRAFPERLMGPTGAGTHPMVMVPLPSVAEAARRKAEAQGLPDLAGLRMLLLRDVLYPEACDAWLGARVLNAPPGEART